MMLEIKNFNKPNRNFSGKPHQSTAHTTIRIREGRSSRGARWLSRGWCLSLRWLTLPQKACWFKPMLKGLRRAGHALYYNQVNLHWDPSNIPDRQPRNPHCSPPVVLSWSAGPGLAKISLCKFVLCKTSLKIKKLLQAPAPKCWVRGGSHLPGRGLLVVDPGSQPGE